MSFREYGSAPDVDSWVTLGGFNNKTGQANLTEIEGYYLGVKTGPSQFDEGKTKVTAMIKTGDGKTVGVNASVNLQIKLERAEKEYRKEEGTAPLGVAIRIKFLGTEPSGKGNPTKLFSVAFNSDDVDVSVLSALAKPEVYEQTNDYEDTVAEETVIAAKSTKANLNSRLNAMSKGKKQ